MKENKITENNIAKNNMMKLTYAEKAGRFLKIQLQEGRRNAPKGEQKGYRDNFAERIGVSRRTLDRYCVSINEIDTLVLIADALGVSVGDMLSDEDVPYVFELERDAEYHLTKDCA